MRNKRLISKYMELYNILISTLNIKTKTISLFDGYDTVDYNYKEFFLYIAKKYNLINDFVDKSIIILDSIDSSKDTLEIDAEYKNVDGHSVNFIYDIVKLEEDEYLLSIKEVKDDVVESADNMTKAKPKSYIDNRAKNDMLTKTPFSIIFVDIDNFKYINETYGNIVGDMVLIELVSAAKNFLGVNGAISRVGGDRFLIIAEIDDNYDIVHDYLFTLKQALQDLPTCKSRGISITVTLSSASFPEDGEYELLLRKCEKALIRGKNKGRDCFIMYLEEKCGKVTLDDKIDDKVVKIDNVSTKNDVYSVITDISQLLGDEKNFDEALNKVISIVGGYFYVDRVSIARLNVKSHRIRNHVVWYNPKISVKHTVYCIDKIIPDWGKALGAKNYVRIDDRNALEDNHPLKEILEVDHTTASIAFELMLNGISYGLIRYDMTTGIRHWTMDNFQALMLISQLISTALQKNYLKDINYRTLYFDSKFNCYNYAKMFSDASDQIVINNVVRYSIVEIDIRNILTLKRIIGDKKMYELVKTMVSVFELDRSVIYGKHPNGPFVLFIEGHNTGFISMLMNRLKMDVDEFSKKNNFHKLSLQIGIFLANSLTDTLNDAMTNANITRMFNKTEDLLYYSDDVKAQLLFRTEMILRIDEALNNDEFLLYLQPKISTKDGKLIGAEALTRWNYKHEKMLFPDQFIPVFEQEGVIEKLDYSVFENVCKYQRNIIDEGLKPVPISVNVSRYVEDFNEYIDRIEFIRNKYDIDSKLIEIEITEGMYFENLLTISQFIEDLHDHGYKVSMDDFGSGYSNLVSMAKLHFDIIKFDKSFCLDLDNNNVKIMLDKLINLIKLMKMSTICEGVETKENVEYLTSIGCEAIQGYYFSKPIPWKEFKDKYVIK
ncbi:MAG: EAL domain-containing protein [Acholeplasmatales bacterium]|nr:EAL domain-containing protein [Acholeplasmatales bacterium]